MAILAQIIKTENFSFTLPLLFYSWYYEKGGTMKISLIAVLFFLSSGLFAEEKKTVQYWIEEKNELIIFHFSTEFPALSEWDRICFLNELVAGKNLFGSDLRQSGSSTTISFLASKNRDTNNSRINRALSVIKARTRIWNISFREIPPPLTDWKMEKSSLFPARAPARADFYKNFRQI